MEYQAHHVSFTPINVHKCNLLIKCLGRDVSETFHQKQEILFSTRLVRHVLVYYILIEQKKIEMKSNGHLITFLWLETYWQSKNKSTLDTVI